MMHQRTAFRPPSSATPSFGLWLYIHPFRWRLSYKPDRKPDTRATFTVVVGPITLTLLAWS